MRIGSWGVHFQHVRTITKNNNGMTFCRIHEGPCRYVKEEGCVVSNDQAYGNGTAMVSRKDIFNKTVGRKAAFTKALHNLYPYQRVKRTEAWLAFRAADRRVREL